MGKKRLWWVWKRSLEIFEDVFDVMAQIKWLVEDALHLDVGVKMFKEMVKKLKEKKTSRRCPRFRLQNFPICRYFGPYSMVKDVG